MQFTGNVDADEIEIFQTGTERLDKYQKISESQDFVIDTLTEYLREKGNRTCQFCIKNNSVPISNQNFTAVQQRSTVTLLSILVLKFSSEIYQRVQVTPSGLIKKLYIITKFIASNKVPTFAIFTVGSKAHLYKAMITLGKSGLLEAVNKFYQGGI